MVTWKQRKTEENMGHSGDTDDDDVRDYLGNVDGVEIVFSPTNTVSYSVLPVANPLDRSAMLTHLLPFTPYQVMVRMVVTNVTHLTRVSSDTVSFTTSVSLQQQLQQRKLVLGDTRDAVIVIFILVIWMVVILLFLHRWGR